MRRHTAAGLLLGVGLGGFADGIVLHQILQWHHMLTATDVASLETNTVWDGAFHAATWVATLAGVLLLARSAPRPPLRFLVGLMLVGWGAFNLVEGVVSHHLLGIHHVRDDVANSLPWDLAFLASGVLLVAVGTLLRRPPAVVDLVAPSRSRVDAR